MTILETTIQALKNLGGKAAYADIYTEYEKICGHNITDTQKAGIRKAIEINSSDSKAYNGKNNIFYSVDGIGKGVWGLR